MQLIKNRVDRNILVKIIHHVNEYMSIDDACRRYGTSQYHFYKEIKKHSDLFDEYVAIRGLTRKNILMKEKIKKMSSSEILNGVKKFKEAIMEIGYCVKCKEKKEMKDTRKETNKKGGLMLKGICKSCGTKMCRMIPREEK